MARPVGTHLKHLKRGYGAPIAGNGPCASSRSFIPIGGAEDDT